MKISDFATFLKGQLFLPELKHKDLVDFLILPVQRIPRYVLLLEVRSYFLFFNCFFQNLSKATKQDHPDKKNIEAAFTAMKEFTEKTNQKKLEREKMISAIQRAKETRLMVLFLLSLKHH